MNKTKDNHINPQALLRFWCKDKWLKCFYKPTLSVVPKTNPKSVCSKRNYLPQDLEEEFAREFDAKISPTITRIISSGQISDDDKLFVSKFQAHQALRNPLLHHIVEMTTQRFLGRKELALPIMRKAAQTSDPRLVDKHMKMYWQLLKSDDPCFVTNEAVDTPDCLDKKYGTITIYFPISPKHCIAMSDKKIDFELDKEMVVWINNMIARYPYSDYIIFNDDFDPMIDITLFENGKQIYPQIA